MSTGTHIRSYDYVNHPYERVRDALTRDARAVFQSATRAAASRARSVASQLRVSIAGVEIAADVAIAVERIEERRPGSGEPPVTTLKLEWEAVNSPKLFPLMRAELSIYPLTATETQLDFAGVYEPPLGPLGSAMNAIIGHRIAEVSVHRFVTELAGYLRATLERTSVA
jgi:hypothetical protein